VTSGWHRSSRRIAGEKRPDQAAFGNGGQPILTALCDSVICFATAAQRIT
jgi:hypothetical protein